MGFKLIELSIFMGVRREGKREHLPPPPFPLGGQNSMFSTFWNVNTMF